MMLAIRWRLSYENKQRDILQAQSSVSPLQSDVRVCETDAMRLLQSEEDEYGYIDEVLEDGTTVTHKVEKAFMDLTDKQNLSFRSVEMSDLSSPYPMKLYSFYAP